MYDFYGKQSWSRRASLLANNRHIIALRDKPERSSYTSVYFKKHYKLVVYAFLIDVEEILSGVT